MAAEKVKIRLQGHEKFALREGWVNKGLKNLSEDSDAFLRKDAPDIFGIGSNMVKSLRYWMKAMGLTNYNGLKLSDLGNLIMKNDPYLENIFTWWILHSNLAQNKSEATTWYMYFNHCDADGLNKEQIQNVLHREIAKYVNGQSFSEKSLNNDIDVLLNMYSKSKDNSDPEDKNVSPFAQLGLIRNLEGKYVKGHPDQKKFDELIVLYEIVQKIGNRESISIEEIIEGENGLAKIYNLTSVVANSLLDRLDAAGYVRVDRTAGLDMIYPNGNLKVEDVLQSYYDKC